MKDYFAYVDIRKTKVSEAYNCLSLDKQIKSFHKVVDEIDSLRKRRRLRVSELPRLRYYEQVNENSESPEEMEEKEELEKKNWKKKKKGLFIEHTTKLIFLVRRREEGNQEVRTRRKRRPVTK